MKVGIVLAAITWLACTAGWSLQAAEFRPLTGVIPVIQETDAADAIQWVTASTRRGTRPSRVINTRYLPAVRSQILSSCGAYAPSYYYKTYQEAREHGWIRPDPDVDPEHVMSPGFTFPLTNRGENNGAGLSTVMNVICRYGIATWADMPESTTWWEYPTNGVWEKAIPYRGDHVIGFNLASNGVQESLKQHLADGDLGVFVVPVSTTFQSYPDGGGVDNGVLYANSSIYDLHALTLVGYDDTRTYSDGITTRTGAFMAVNSWGQGWGVLETNAGTKGFCWLGYDYMATNRAGDSGVYAMIDRTNYVPREFARITIGHQSRHDLNVSISPGNNPTNYLGAFPRGGGGLPYHGTITIDVTDFMNNPPEIYKLSAIDWSGGPYSPEVGTFSTFEVIRANGVVMTNRETPLTLTNSDIEKMPDTWRWYNLFVGSLEADPRHFWDDTLQTPCVAWADFNRDDSPDFALFGSESTNYLCGIYENDGSGNFTKQDIDLPDLNSIHMAWADYNNDGLPDLAVSGRTAYPELASVCYLFRNDAGINLTNSGIVLPAEQSGLAWGDYDQDGDLDLAFSSGKLYRNDNGTNLTDSGITLLGGAVAFKSISWCDLENDGFLDLEINGIINQNKGGTFQTDSLNPPSITSYNIPPIWHDFDADGLLDAASEGYIFHNNGFTYSPGEPDYGVPDAWRIWMQKGDLVYSNWAFPERDVADFNNDGLLDIALSGAIGSSANVRFSVFKQETNQTFNPIGLQQDGFIHGSVTWCDYDGDCDTDLLAGGYDSSINPVLASYNNTLADCGLPNTPPDAPQRFVTTITNDNILLRFHPAYDKETLPARLAYEVRVGTAPGLADIVSPFGLGPFPGNARPIGALSFPENPYYYQKFMNTNALPGIRLRNLSPGRYFWSVRTIDTARAPSPWSTEQAFTLTTTGTLRFGDINGDGFVDVADLIQLRNMLSGALTPDPSTADLDDDGSVTDSDSVILANLILNISTDGFLPQNKAEIGPAGGTLTAGAFTLTIPPGSFSDTNLLTLSTSTGDPIFGSSSPRQLWRIEGLPSDLTGTLTLSGPDQRASSTTAVSMALGQWFRPYGVNDDTLEPARTFCTVPGTLENGKLVTQLPASLLFDENRTATRAATNHFTFKIDSGWLWDSYSMKTPHFVIHWDGLTPSYILSLGNELEAAFDFYSASGYPFTTKRNWTTYPVQVYLKTSKDAGGEVHFSDNGAYIELNINSMKVNEYRRCTVYHEFFHLVQGLINPGNSISEAFNKKLLLLNEATATWMERYGSATPADYEPQNYMNNKLRIFDGLSAAASSKAGQAGYAFSSLIDYLTTRDGPGIITNIYNNIIAGKTPIQAILNAASPTGNLDWHHDYYRTLLERQIYPNSPIMLYPKATLTPEWPGSSGLHQETFKATSNDLAGTTFSYSMPGLGAKGFRFQFTPEAYNALSNTSALVLSADNSLQDKDLSIISAVVMADPRGTVPFELYGTDPNRIRCRVPNLKSHLSIPSDPSKSMRSFIALLTRANASEADTFRTGTLTMTVADQLDGAYSIPDFVHGQFLYNNENAGAPQFTCSTRHTLTDLTGHFYTGTTEVIPGTTDGYSAIVVYQDGRIDVPVTFHATPTGPAYTDIYAAGTTNSFTRITLKSQDGYQLSKRLWLGPSLEEQPYVFEPRSFSGSEVLYLDADEQHVYYNIFILFTVYTQQYHNGAPTGTPTPIDTFSSAVSVSFMRK